MEILRNVQLAPFTTMGLGGPAAYFVRAQQRSDVAAAIDLAAQQNLKVQILGGGSNLVIADEGCHNLVITVEFNSLEFHFDGSDPILDVQAGKIWDELVRECVHHGWQGLECLSGIPGRVGAAPIQNIGAYGQEVAESIQAVQVLSRHTRQVQWLAAPHCQFGYRDSFFKSQAPDEFIILAVRFRLRTHTPPSLRYPELVHTLDKKGIVAPSLSDVRQTVLDLRRQKSMLVTPDDPNSRSCGSFFLNPWLSPAQVGQIVNQVGTATPIPQFPHANGNIKLSAAWLIEQSGFLKGHLHQSAAISTRHALALIARPPGRARDVVELAWQIRRAVEQKFGVKLVPEPIFWGFHQLDHGLPVLPSSLRVAKKLSATELSQQLPFLLMLITAPSRSRRFVYTALVY